MSLSPEEQERLNALETELEQLRHKAEGTGSLESHSDDARFYVKPTPQKVIALAIGFAALCLAMIFTIFIALSKGFDSFAHKAAQTFEPNDEGEVRKTPTVKSKNEEAVRVPGF